MASVYPSFHPSNAGSKENANSSSDNPPVQFIPYPRASSYPLQPRHLFFLSKISRRDRTSSPIFTHSPSRWSPSLRIPSSLTMTILASKQLISLTLRAESSNANVNVKIQQVRSDRYFYIMLLILLASSYIAVTTALYRCYDATAHYTTSVAE